MFAHVPIPDQNPWPELPLAAWHDTYATLHMWTQVVGKVRLALSPPVNHWWEVPLYINARGLTTSPIPCGNGIFEVQFDFIDHEWQSRPVGTHRKLCRFNRNLSPISIPRSCRLCVRSASK